ncbi:MAG: oligosaccharide flippase family protein [Bacteroidales bacterium]
MATTANKFLNSILKFSVASWVSAGIAFISIPIVTHFFSPEEFGKINMFTMAMGIIVSLIGLSMEQSYVRFFKEVETEIERKKILTQCIAVVGCGFLVYLIANLFLGKWLSYYLFDEMNFWLVYIAMPLTVLFTIVMSYQSFYFRMSEMALGFAIISILGVLANKVAMVGAALISPNYTMGVLFMTLSLGLLVVGYCIFAPRSFNIFLPKLEKKEVMPLLKYALPLAPVAFIVLLNTFVIRFMLKDYVSYSALGLFTAATSIAGVLSIVQAGFVSYWVPFLFANYKTQQVFIQKIHSVITLLMVVVSLLIIMFSDIFFLVLGESYRASKSIFPFLLIQPVTNTILYTTYCGIAISKKSYLQTIASLFTFIFSTALAIILIPKFGILGAALSNAGMGLCFFYCMSYFGGREYQSTERFWRTTLTLGVLIVACIVNYMAISAMYKNIVFFLLLLFVMVMYVDVLSRLSSYLKIIKLNNKIK